MGNMANMENLLSPLSVWEQHLIWGCGHLTACHHPVPSYIPCASSLLSGLGQSEVELSMRVQTNTVVSKHRGAIQVFDVLT